MRGLYSTVQALEVQVNCTYSHKLATQNQKTWYTHPHLNTLYSAPKKRRVKSTFLFLVLLLLYASIFLSFDRYERKPQQSFFPIEGGLISPGAHWAKAGGVGTLFLKLSLSLGNVKEIADIWYGALQTPYRQDTKGIFHL